MYDLMFARMSSVVTIGLTNCLYACWLLRDSVVLVVATIQKSSQEWSRNLYEIGINVLLTFYLCCASNEVDHATNRKREIVLHCMLKCLTIHWCTKYECNLHQIRLYFMAKCHNLRTRHGIIDHTQLLFHMITLKRKQQSHVKHNKIGNTHVLSPY